MFGEACGAPPTRARTFMRVKVVNLLVFAYAFQGHRLYKVNKKKEDSICSPQTASMH